MAGEVVIPSKRFLARTAAAVLAYERTGLDTKNPRAWQTPPQVFPFDCVVKEEYDNHLICKRWNGSDEEGDTFFVAKPWFLRRTSYDGLTRNGITYTYTNSMTRSATDGVTTQSEQLTMPYWLPETGFKGEVITVEPKALKTGVVVSGQDVYIEDCNRAARTWAKVVS